VANSDPDRVLIHLQESPALFAELKIQYLEIYISTNRELLTEAMETGSLKSHDPHLLAIMLVGAVDALFAHLATSGEDDPFSPIPSLVFDHIISPLLVEGASEDKESKQ